MAEFNTLLLINNVHPALPETHSEENEAAKCSVRDLDFSDYERPL